MRLLTAFLVLTVLIPEGSYALTMTASCRVSKADIWDGSVESCDISEFAQIGYACTPTGDPFNYLPGPNANGPGAAYNQDFECLPPSSCANEQGGGCALPLHHLAYTRCIHQYGIQYAAYCMNAISGR